METQTVADILALKFREPVTVGIVSAYLYGSLAEKRDHRESDIDVGVLLDRAVHPHPRDRFEQRLVLGTRLAAGLAGRPLDVVVLNDAPPLLARHIVTRGTLIHCSDPAANHIFVRDIQLRAADLEPFLRRMRRIKLEALERG
jgi:predicted nucleotidyltransferase